MEDHFQSWGLQPLPNLLLNNHVSISASWRYFEHVKSTGCLCDCNIGQTFSGRCFQLHPTFDWDSFGGKQLYVLMFSYPQFFGLPPSQDFNDFDIYDLWLNYFHLDFYFKTSSSTSDAVFFLFPISFHFYPPYRSDIYILDHNPYIIPLDDKDCIFTCLIGLGFCPCPFDRFICELAMHPIHRLHRQGIEPHPGPSYFEDDHDGDSVCSFASSDSGDAPPLIESSGPSLRDPDSDRDDISSLSDGEPPAINLDDYFTNAKHNFFGNPDAPQQDDTLYPDSEDEALVRSLQQQGPSDANPFQQEESLEALDFKIIDDQADDAQTPQEDVAMDQPM